MKLRKISEITATLPFSELDFMQKYRAHRRAKQTSERIKEVYRQQSALAQKQEVKHRIVSIDRPYIRPIVRGQREQAR